MPQAPDNLREIKNLLDKIEYQQKNIREDHKERINLFLNIIFFDLALPKNKTDLKKNLFVFRNGRILTPDYVLLLILKIKLFIKYENTFLILNRDIFTFLKNFIIKFLNNFKLQNFDDDVTLEVEITRSSVPCCQFRSSSTTRQCWCAGTTSSTSSRRR